jgi:hypothetical protein
MKKAGHDGTCLKSQLLGRWRQEDLKLTKLAKPWGSRRGEEGEEEIQTSSNKNARISQQKNYTRNVLLWAKGK